YDEEESTSFGSIYGTNWVTDYVGVVGTWSRVLSVLMHDDDEQMDGYRQDNKRGDNHEGKRVQARANVLTRAFAANEEHRHVAAPLSDAIRNTIDNPRPDHRENTVRQCRAGET